MRIFVTSDIHSYFTSFKKALDKAGYDQANPEHLLVVCGDLFDRGDESVEVYEYFKNNPKAILVAGNHEDMLISCLSGKHYSMTNVTNRTVKTIMDLGEQHDFMLNAAPIVFNAYQKACQITSEKMNFLWGRYRNYFETENYIFVHSWIPTIFSDKGQVYNPDWKNASPVEWNEAMWGNPFEQAMGGLNQTGKTIVFGHWHTSWYRAQKAHNFDLEWGKDACFDPVHDKDLNVIGLDACTAYTGKCNVIVLEDNLLN